MWGGTPPQICQCTGTQQVDPTNVQTQDVEENAELAELDTSEQQAPVANTDSQVDEEQQEPEIPKDQTSQVSQDDNYLTAIDVMSRMTKYSSAIQLHNHSCQEVSEYPL